VIDYEAFRRFTRAVAPPTMPHGRRCPVCWMARVVRWIRRRTVAVWDWVWNGCYWIRHGHDWGP
jgi:hypothetical protein